MTKNFLLAFLALVAATAQTARAQSAPAPADAASAASFLSAVSGNINVTSNYKFRGQDQGSGKGWSPAVQGGFDWSQNGFYVGNWNSNIGFAGNIEMDFYGGYKGEIAKDLGYDVGLLQYYYPQNHGDINFNTTEIYGALSYSFLSLKYSHTVSSDYFGIGRAQGAAGVSPRPKGRNTGYLDLSANYPLAAKLTLNAHLGYTRYASDLRHASYSSDDGEDGVTTTDVGVPNYTDWKLGATYDLGSGFSLAGALVGASKRSFYGDINKTRIVVTLTKAL